MVLTFALCATFVFAQSLTPRMQKETKALSSAAKVQNERMNSSIFTKDATTLVTVDFSAENVGYSTSTVTGGVDGHSQNYSYAFWRRIANADSATIAAEAEVYPALVQNYFGDIETFASYLARYADTATSSAENGFMMMSMYDQRTPNSGNFNAYIRIDGIDASSATVVDVELFQYYRKYYDNCYVDFSTNGTSWTETEINVTGVDMEVNDALAGMYTYTLPLAAAGNSNLSIRIRYYSPNTHRGSAYGYYWLVDDVSIIAGEADRLRPYDQEYVEGAYGLVPQGLEMNTAWYAQVLNNGSNPQNNVNAKLYHLDAAQSTATEFAAFNNGTIAPTQLKGVIVDNGGWILYDSLEYRGWYGYRTGAPNGTGTVLPTNVAGDNYLYATVSNDNVNVNYDTMYYQVTTADANGDYRWGHDNGVLTYSPYNYWLFGYVLSGGNWYVTEDAEDVHFYSPNYYVTDRFATGANVPEGWVIRGVELVASPVEDYHSTGAKISAILTTDEYEGGSVRFPGVLTGANVKEITDADINDSNMIGRNSHGYLTVGNYNTVYIEFPEQPALLPNTVYRAGYAMEEEGYFALAQQAMGSYRMASPTRPDRYDTIIYFKNDEATAKYGSYFTCNQYSTFFNDPSYGGDGSSSTFASYYYEPHPMIHLIVGPAHQVNRAAINVSCEGEDFGYASYGGQNACGTTINPVEGSTAVVSGFAQTGCIAHVYVDGELVEPYDEDTEEGDPNLRVVDYGEDGIGYEYYFREVMGEDNNIKFVFEEQIISIDPVAAGVRMNLQPNPATTQVSLNIQGVNGMVNCMLIDMSGRVVYNQNVNAEASNVINLSNLAKGAYFVRITNDKFSKVEKLIVR